MKLIIFGASWCNPCVIFKEQLEKADIVFDYIDVDEAVATSEGQERMNKYKVKTVPCIVFYNSENDFEVFRQGMTIGYIKEKMEGK